MNAATTIVLIVFVIAVITAVYATWKRSHRTSDAPACSCGCSDCAKAASCADFFVPAEEAGE